MDSLSFELVQLEIPQDANIVLGQSHFIKTVEDVYEALVNSSPQIRFAVAFNEASGPRLTRVEGNEPELKDAAAKMAAAVGAGHFFAVVMKQAFPINTLKAIQSVPEVCNIFCATANPVQVIVAKSAQGRGVMGVIDGSEPLGIEKDEHILQRHSFLRAIGYKR